MDNEQKQNNLIVLNKSTIEMTKYDVNLEYFFTFYLGSQ